MTEIKPETWPLYEQVARRLRAAIDQGKYQPGDQLPAETELSDCHEVSRETVRKALQQLTQEGLLTSGRGRGRFVRSYAPLRSHLSHAADVWANEVQEQGCQPEQRIEVGIVEPPRQVAHRLQLPSADDYVVVRRRVRYVDSVPSQLADSYFRESFARNTPLMEPRDVSVPGGVLAWSGHQQARFRDEITIRMPTREESQRLDLQPGTPVGDHVRTGYTADDAALCVTVTVVPGDRNVLVYELDAS